MTGLATLGAEVSITLEAQADGINGGICERTVLPFLISTVAVKHIAIH